MSPAAIVAALREWLAGAGDPAVRRSLETLIPGARTVGVPVPALRVAAIELRRLHRDLPLETVADITDMLVESRVREEILIGTFWLARYGKKLQALPWSRVTAWLPALDNWETCDQLAMGVAAPLLDAAPDLGSLLLPLTGARSHWVRRLALATASALNQKGRSHVAETLTLCAPLVADPAPEVRKAVGWALRAATVHDPGAVERFLRAHRAPDASHSAAGGSGEAQVERQMRAEPRGSLEHALPAPPGDPAPTPTRRRLRGSVVRLLLITST
jgi:3-methyladenine DNA glycosylase AlkD